MPVGASVFIDTNLLVYSLHTGDTPHKSARAVEVLTLLRERDAGALSAQVIAEFVSVARRKLTDTLAPEIALRAAELFAEQFHVVPLDEVVVREALRATARYAIDYFDAQVWAAAKVAGCRVLLTEDSHGEVLEGVAYVDPFDGTFSVEEFASGL